ncbi:MAG: response regulator transcription factor [Lachnospiraceae bacterium]|nr:response regulator transcription factor [Lachnospiraceae bacterium]
MDTSTILIVDDNQEIREIIEILLTGEGLQTVQAADGMTALALLKEQNFDLIILDIMMPEMNGYQTCLEIRKTSNAPILFLSARTKESDKTLGFSSGGDDYLPKPFSYNELLNRVKALIRRYHVYKGKEESPEPFRTLHYQQLIIDEASRQVTKNGTLIELTDTEYRILLLFLKNRGQNFSAERLYEAIWEESYYYGANNTVMVHIRNLRRKIEDDANKPLIIKTIWGKGYRCD